MGILRPITCGRSQQKLLPPMLTRGKRYALLELNAGQMVEDVRLAVNGKIKVNISAVSAVSFPDPDEIVATFGRKIIK